MEVIVKKGISLVVLIITIIVLTVLMGIIIFNAENTIVNAEKSKLQIDIVSLESLMDTYKIRKNGNIKFNVTFFDTSTLSGAELQQFDGETISNNKIELYVIELKEIDAETLSYGNLIAGEKDRYLYSINTGKVYYEQGLKIDNITYYHIENGEG